MPSTEAIMWGGISGLILAMLAIIGYLISNGFDGLKEQLKMIWEKIDRHQSQAEANALAIAGIQARCKELHANHHRMGEDQ